MSAGCKGGGWWGGGWLRGVEGVDSLDSGLACCKGRPRLWIPSMSSNWEKDDVGRRMSAVEVGTQHCQP